MNRTRTHSLSTAPQYSHISSMTACLSNHGGGRRQCVNMVRGEGEHIRGRSTSASMVGGSSSSIAVSTKSTSTASRNAVLSLEQFYQTQSRFGARIQLKSSRINTFEEKYSRINGQRPTYEGTDAMNYIMLNAFSTEMFCYSNFDKTEGNLCQKVMSKITLPYGVKDEFYYEEIIAPMIHIKYHNIKSNFQNTVRDVVLGEFVHLFNLVITANLTISFLFGIWRIEGASRLVLIKIFCRMTRNHFGNSLIQSRRIWMIRRMTVVTWGGR